MRAFAGTGAGSAGSGEPRPGGPLASCCRYSTTTRQFACAGGGAKRFMATCCRYAPTTRQPGPGGRPDGRTAAWRRLLPAAHRRRARSLGNLATLPSRSSSPHPPRCLCGRAQEPQLPGLVDGRGAGMRRGRGAEPSQRSDELGNPATKERSRERDDPRHCRQGAAQGDQGPPLYEPDPERSDQASGYSDDHASTNDPRPAARSRSGGTADGDRSSRDCTLPDRAPAQFASRAHPFKARTTLPEVVHTPWTAEARGECKDRTIRGRLPVA